MPNLQGPKPIGCTNGWLSTRSGSTTVVSGVPTGSGEPLGTTPDQTAVVARNRTCAVFWIGFLGNESRPRHSVFAVCESDPTSETAEETLTVLVSFRSRRLIQNFR